MSKHIKLPKWLAKIGNWLKKEQDHTVTLIKISTLNDKIGFYLNGFIVNEPGTLFFSPGIEFGRKYDINPATPDHGIIEWETFYYGISAIEIGPLSFCLTAGVYKKQISALEDAYQRFNGKGPVVDAIVAYLGSVDSDAATAE